MNELQIFKNEEFGEIRTQIIDGDPWFVAIDVCHALDIDDVGKAVGRLDKDESRRIEIDHPQSTDKTLEVYAVNEPGLYSLVLGSRKQEAKSFKRWITHDVIPSIRKNGGYIANQENLTPEQIVANALVVANKILEDKERKIKSLESDVLEMSRRIDEMQPKCDYVDMVLSSRDAVLVTQIAQDYGMSAKKFNALLKALRIQHKVGEQWILYADYQGKGYVKNQTATFDKPDGSIGTSIYTKWTQKGQLFLYEKLKAYDVIPLMELEGA